MFLNINLLLHELAQIQVLMFISAISHSNIYLLVILTTVWEENVTRECPPYQCGVDSRIFEIAKRARICVARGIAWRGEKLGDMLATERPRAHMMHGKRSPKAHISGPCTLFGRSRRVGDGTSYVMCPCM